MFLRNIRWGLVGERAKLR